MTLHICALHMGHVGIICHVLHACMQSCFRSISRLTSSRSCLQAYVIYDEADDCYKQWTLCSGFYFVLVCAPSFLSSWGTESPRIDWQLRNVVQAPLLWLSMLVVQAA